MISKKNLFYQFSKKNQPIERVETGKKIVIETIDAFGNQIQKDEDKLDSLDWDRVNPATGPIFINGAEKGDLLKVTIHDIKINSKGVMASIPNAGIFGDTHIHSTIKFFDLTSDFTKLNDISIPIEPMIGVIGVAPDEISISNGEPGAHGGNMDNKLISKGTILYLPIFNEGALFGLGDLHACMGDGEVNVTGIEVGGEVTVSFDVIKGISHNNPLMIKGDYLYTIFSHESLDEAVIGASKEMHYWLSKALKYDNSDTAMLMSLMANLEICQVVDPKKTIRMKMPKKYFDNLGL